ncbi:MAG: response regulator transcription factor [Dehalococcoidales bacterium]|nr:response regulator transcription factor [Dehalococcoidales bacterium]
MLNILLIGKQPIFRQGLVTALESTPDLRVIKETDDSKEALSSEGIAPDIILFDIDDNDGSGLEVEMVSQLQDKYPESKIIILANSAREDMFVKALKAGIQGYLLKTSSVEKLVDSTRLVASGDTVVFAGEGNMALCSLMGPAQHNGRNGASLLSPREREILCRIARGETTKEVAFGCYISPTTVKAHVAKILYKLNVKNRSEAVAIAIEQRLLEHRPSNRNSMVDGLEIVGSNS